jgi:arylsulfatase A-like enzyme
MPGNVLFITVDQWRGDCLSAVGHPLLETPALDRLAAAGTLFANHWANAAPCGPSRACLYTGTYLHHNRSIQNGTPLDARFTNVALLARQAGYEPALFGYTDTSVDPRTVPPGDPSLYTYESVLPGFEPVVLDPWEQGSPAWARWLAARGVDVPSNPHHLFHPVRGFPGAADHGATWAPARFRPEHSPSTFLVSEVIEWLERHGDRPFFAHASFIGPHPPRRNPVGYHDLYDADDIGPFVAGASREVESEAHPLNRIVMNLPGLAAPEDERERRQIRATYYGAQRETDDRLARLFDYLDTSGLAEHTLVVVTGDHGEMGGDHWLLEKLGYWDESYHVPLIIRDPRPEAEAGWGSVVREFTESVDVLPTVCEWLGIAVPDQADGWPLTPFLRGEGAPAHWRSAAHWEWDFSNPRGRMAETFFGIPSSHCSLVVARGSATKYVQFAADPDVLPPLWFDLEADPAQLDNRAGELGAAGATGWAAQEIVRWRMCNEERTLSTRILTPDVGLVVGLDDWR